MKTISLWQPWASLWLTPAKIHETRHWKTPYIGPLGVHAAKTIAGPKEVGPEVNLLCVQYFGQGWQKTLPLGKVLGHLYLEGCYPTDEHSPRHHSDLLCGNWTGGRFAWARAEGPGPWKLATPIPWKGQQGFWDVPNEHFFL